MDKLFLHSVIKQYLAKLYCCYESDLDTTNTIFSTCPNAMPGFMKIMTYRNCTIVCTSAELQSHIKSEMSPKNRDEIFEHPLVYGETIHYIPNLDLISEPILPDQFSYELLCESTICKLSNLSGFENSVSMSESGCVSTQIALVARHNGKIIGIAGAGKTSDLLWEVGIDVDPNYRNANLGTNLVRKLTIEILKRGIVPFYSASITNLGSQMVASRSGYEPCWIDTFGNIFDDLYPYKAYIQPSDKALKII